MLDVLWADEHLVAINKPTGLLVHRSKIDRYETRFAIQLLRDQIGQHVWPLHRLDKPTSGVLLFGLSAEIARSMAAQFADHTLSKTYLAVVRGYTDEQGLIDHALKEQWDKTTDPESAKNKPAQDAVTEYQRLATAEIPVEIEGHPSSRYSLIRCMPTTGRKHQLRRHMKHISHPIIGDARYGRGRHNRWFAENFDAGRLLLHAETLAFDHPITGERIHLSAAISDGFSNAVRQLGWSAAFDDSGFCLPPSVATADL